MAHTNWAKSKNAYEHVLAQFSKKHFAHCTWPDHCFLWKHLLCACACHWQLLSTTLLLRLCVTLKQDGERCTKINYSSRTKSYSILFYISNKAYNLLLYYILLWPCLSGYRLRFRTQQNEIRIPACKKIYPRFCLVPLSYPVNIAAVILCLPNFKASEAHMNE